MRPRIADFFETVISAGNLVPDYTVMLSIAILSGIYLTVDQADKSGLDSSKVFSQCLIITVVSIIGGRIYVVLFDLDLYLSQPLDIFNINKGGLASTGAFAGAGIAAIASAKLFRLPLGKCLDSLAPSGMLALVLVRTGCFLNGCCYGKISELPWAMRFPEGSGPHQDHFVKGFIGEGQMSLPVHPTQLYEALIAFLIFIFLVNYRKRQKYAGERFAILFLLYPIGRFFNEFMRGDERIMLFSLSLPQYFHMMAFILAAIFLSSRYRLKAAVTVPGVAKLQ